MQHVTCTATCTQLRGRLLCVCKQAQNKHEVHPAESMHALGCYHTPHQKHSQGDKMQGKSVVVNEHTTAHSCNTRDLSCSIPTDEPQLYMYLVAQLVEHQSRTQDVTGSNPAQGSSVFFL